MLEVEPTGRRGRARRRLHVREAAKLMSSVSRRPFKRDMAISVNLDKVTACLLLAVVMGIA